MSNPKNAILPPLWEWVKGAHTGALAKRCQVSTQHIRNVLQGKRDDPDVIQEAIKLRAEVVKKDRELMEKLTLSLQELTNKKAD